MKLSNPKFPAVREVPGSDSESAWIDSLLAPRDKWAKELATALQGLISTDNLNGDLRDLDLFDDTPVEVTARVSGPVVAAILVFHDRPDYARLFWEPIDSNKVSVAVIWDVIPDGSVPCRILFLGN